MATAPKKAATGEKVVEKAPAPPDDRYTSGYDFLIANGPIGQDMMSKIMKACSQERQHDRLVLALLTYGGDANAGYRIGRLLQAFYQDLTVLVPAVCKSAGTLIACSANRIAMSPLGELGPLDVQILKRDELFERRSGLITKHALLELQDHTFKLYEHFMLRIKARGPGISFKMATDIATRISADVMRTVYDHVNVDAIGEDARNLAVAIEYCQRLDKRFNNLKAGCADRLVHDYPSHDFVIDSDEAQELFARVELPSPTLLAFMSDKEHIRDTIVPNPRNTVVRMVKWPKASEAAKSTVSS